MTALVQLAGLAKTLRGQEEPRPILTGVDLTLHSGESVAVLGRSGSGKSTLLSLIGLFDRADGGQYLLDGRDITRISDRRAAALRSAEFGFVFQRFFLLKHLTAAQNVAMALVNGQGWLPRRRRRAKVLTALDQVGIAHLARQRPVRLSGGEQQRVAIARALVREPRVILADEPTGALDTETGNLVVDALRATTEHGCALVLVTHEPEHAARMGRVLRLRDGVLHPETVPATGCPRRRGYSRDPALRAASLRPDHRLAGHSRPQDAHAAVDGQPLPRRARGGRSRGGSADR